MRELRFGGTDMSEKILQANDELGPYQEWWTEYKELAEIMEKIERDQQTDKADVTSPYSMKPLIGYIARQEAAVLAKLPHKPAEPMRFSQGDFVTGWNAYMAEVERLEAKYRG